ncbi:MAG: hypothetical protein RMJ97_06975 [Raineya sp.]|nr:hypothetical protein [Raineya sp.]MDW8296612.1 hypothetical protein [Raineya sp.]
MLEALVNSILHKQCCTKHELRYHEVTQDSYFNDDEYFIVQEHQSLATPAGYVSDSEVITFNHIVSNQIFTINTGYFEFFSTNPVKVARGYLLTILERESKQPKQSVNVELLTNEDNEIVKVKAYEREKVSA